MKSLLKIIVVTGTLCGLTVGGIDIEALFSNQNVAPDVLWNFQIGSFALNSEASAPAQSVTFIAGVAR